MRQFLALALLASAGVPSFAADAPLLKLRPVPCPPNVARTLASLGGYAYAVSDDALWVNLYIQGSATASVNGRKVMLNVETDYPWDGKVVLEPYVDQTSKFDLRLRIPGWCHGATVSVNGENVSEPTTDRGYIVVGREWKGGDVVELNLPMPVQRMAANPNVQADTGQLAIQRGPLVYCLEACDQSVPLSALFLPQNAELRARWREDLLGRVVVVVGLAATAPELEWSKVLYQPIPAFTPVEITAISYYAWDNRKPGPMKVWLPQAPRTPALGGLETQAKVSMSYVSGNSQPWGINDGLEPKSSGEQPAALCHWWPHHGRGEWVQYTWKKPVTLKSARVYWFDDTVRGACRLPASWRIEYREGEAWKPVAASIEYPVKEDAWCEVSFTPVTTTALRLAVKPQEQWAAGVHEWKVEEVDED